MTIPDAAASSRKSSRPFGWQYLQTPTTAKLPHLLKIDKLIPEFKDLGDCGFFNQQEFGLMMDKIAPLDSWKLFNMETTFEAVERVCVTKILHECVKVPSTPMPPPEPAPAELGEDFLFDMKTGAQELLTPTLGLKLGDPEVESEVGSAFMDELDEQERSDGLAGVMEEGDGSEEDIFGPKPVEENQGKEEQSKRPRLEDHDNQSEAGSERSRGSGGSHQPHQQATNTQLLKEVLGDRPGSVYWCMDRNGVQYQDPTITVSLEIMPVELNSKYCQYCFFSLDSTLVSSLHMMKHDGVMETL